MSAEKHSSEDVALSLTLAIVTSSPAPLLLLDASDIEIQMPRQPARHRIVQARRLDYLDLQQTRILVAVSDVTDARADATLKEEAARRNRIRLQEVRHRVANSLQIIASRAAPPEEAQLVVCVESNGFR